MAASDFGEDVEGLSEILGEKIGRKELADAFKNALKAGAGTKKGIVMASVGDDDGGVGEGGDVGRGENGGFESLDALPRLSGDEKWGLK